jgi:lipopolysaccharide export system permease protein
MKNKFTTPELKRFISMEEVRGSEGLNTYKEERYHRDATPFSVIILTMIAAVIATRKVRGGSGVLLAVGLVMAAIFVIMDKFSITFATKGNFRHTRCLDTISFLVSWPCGFIGKRPNKYYSQLIINIQMQ